jgi:hypothetical protein
MSTVTAILFRAGGDDTGIDIEPLPVAVSSLADLQRFVGGYVDAVRETFNPSQLFEEDDIPSEAREFVGVGYVHDEGIILGLPVNRLASIVFGRELYGDVVMVSGTSPDDEYDGENYDVPSWFADAVHNGSLQESVEQIELIASVTTALKVCIADGVVTAQTLSAMLLRASTGDPISQASVEELCNYGQARLLSIASDTDIVGGTTSLDDDEIAKFWEEETE